MNEMEFRRFHMKYLADNKLGKWAGEVHEEMVVKRQTHAVWH